jgi:CBS domain-containing protein
MEAYQVSDWMTADPISVSPGTPLSRAREIMKEAEVRRLLVIDGDRLVGIVTDGDLSEAWPSPYNPLEPHEMRMMMSRIPVDEIMQTELVTVEPDATIQEAVNLMFENRIGALPVVQDERVVGILTNSDILQGLVRLLSEREHEHAG